MDNFDFLAPVIASRHKTPPTLALPVSLCLCVAWVLELVFFFLPRRALFSKPLQNSSRNGSACCAQGGRHTRFSCSNTLFFF